MQDFEKLGVFYLGRPYDVNTKSQGEGLILYDSKDLVTHAVCIGMTGSGKTGLCINILEEAVLDGIPAISIDPKGDITNLLLTFPNLQSEDFAPWVNEEDALRANLSKQAYAVQQAELWKNGLAKWGESGERIQRLRQAAEFTILTPGSTAGLPVSVLKSFSVPPSQILEDNELLQERISTTVTSLLGLLSIEADPIRSREHILISTIFLDAWRHGRDLSLAELIQLIQSPPLTRIGVLDVDSFYPSKERFALAMQLNNLLASPGFQFWLEGEPLDMDKFLYGIKGKPKVSIFYIAHLSDAERMFFVSLLLNHLVGWMRTQSGTTSLRALLYIDEVFGYLPPVANPSSKMPLLTLLKQARAFGIGVVLATQNPVDLDYKALSNTGTWFIGRLQTERDKARVLDAFETASTMPENKFERPDFDNIIGGLSKRIFLMHNVHENEPVVFETRWAMSYLRGPLTREQIKRLMDPIKLKTTEPAPTHLAEKAPVTATSPSTEGFAEAKQRPVLPPDVLQYFVPISDVDKPESASLIYRPMILGAAQVRFLDLRKMIDVTKDAVFATPIIDEPVPVDWNSSAEMKLDVSSLGDKPAGIAMYSVLPSAATKAQNYKSWQKDFANWVSKTQKVELMRSQVLNTFSKPGENERDFRLRLQQAGREQRDQSAEKLRQKYAASFSKLDQRIRRAQSSLAEQTAQAREQKYDTAISFGSALLGSFLGRKARSSATRTARGISRTMKEAQDKANAELELKVLQQERSRLEAQFQSELSTIDARTNPLTENLETIAVAPMRNNISVRLLALVWVPHWQDTKGTITSAWK